MASIKESLAVRTMARVRRFMGITSSSEISDSHKNLQESIHYGMFTEDELRHVDGILNAYDPNKGQRKALSDNDITTYLQNIASSTRRKIDEIKSLKILAPEIEQAKSIIISSIMSPVDLQTDSVSVKVDHPGLTQDTNDKISEYLSNFFNKEYQLGPKIVEWLGCAGFEEGAKPILVLPKNQIDVLNVVADRWDPEAQREFKEFKQALRASTEGLLTIRQDSEDWKKMSEAIEAYAQISLENAHVGSEFVATENANGARMPDNARTKEAAKIGADDKLTSGQLAKVLTEKSFELIRTTERGDCVIVTRNLSDLGKIERSNDERVDELAKEAERQIRGFHAEDVDGVNRPSFPVLSISDVIKTGNSDMPIVIELPCDAVVPVHAPNDAKVHIGYYILLDENGQPIRGQYSFHNGVTSDVNDRLATNAAKSVYGANVIQTYMQAGMTTTQALDQMTQVFSCAVNHLLRDKLTKDGLKGLDISVHEAVGKSLFFNLLAKNKIKMVFVPSPMMVYYRFLHRDDGTGKTFLEDIAFLLALRVTLVIAKIMAAVDNATQHRRIEVNVDEKNANPLETLELVRHQYLSKKAPQFATDPSTAAEAIINSHLSIVPKGLVGNTDDLSVTTEKTYGNSQAPDENIMDTINNWVGQGLKVPPSALNQLNDAEYAKSVATSNLFFSNAVRGWQNIIHPFNKKFIMNYILCNDQMLEEIRKFINDDFSGSKSKTKKDVKKAELDNPDEHQNQDPENDEMVEEALKRVISTAELVLAPPNMSTSKAHFEEINAQVDAVNKMLDVIYPDDVAPNDELRSLMASIRAVIASKAFREFLPKLGFHEITEVPSMSDISIDESIKILLRLSEIKKRTDSIVKMHNGQLADQAAAGTGDEFSTGGIGDNPSGGSDNGGENPGGGLDLPEFKL